MVDSPLLTPVQICQVELTAVPTKIYKVPNGKTCVVQKLTVANTTLNFIDVYVGLVPEDTVGDSTNRIMHDTPVPPEGIVSFDMFQVFTGTIAAYAEAVGLVLTVSGSLFDAAARTWDAAVGSWDAVPAGVTWDNYA